MTDPETLQLLDQLKAMGENFGLEIDTQKMCWDLGYANQILTEMGNTHDQKQGWIVLQLMQQLCLIDGAEGICE